ncbi:MAG: DUF971 domain-containing protein [Stappiaceae bacterium]
MEENKKVWPTELKLKKDRRALEITFNNGESFLLAAEFLRTQSPSAEVQGHSPDQRKTVPGKINVELLKIDPVGNYAVKLHFDDMHNTGLYSWSYLRELGLDHDTLWQRYLSELKEQGLSRNP